MGVGVALLLVGFLAQAWSFVCYGLPDADPKVCNGRGYCGAPETCTCDPNYSGPQCAAYSCFGTPVGTPGECSGHGICESHDNCKCNYTWLDPDCSLYVPSGVPNVTNPLCSVGSPADVAYIRHSPFCFTVTGGPYPEPALAITGTNYLGCTSGVGYRVSFLGALWPGYSFVGGFFPSRLYGLAKVRPRTLIIHMSPQGAINLQQSVLVPGVLQMDYRYDGAVPANSFCNVYAYGTTSVFNYADTCFNVILREDPVVHGSSTLYVRTIDGTNHIIPLIPLLGPNPDLFGQSTSTAVGVFDATGPVSNDVYVADIALELDEITEAQALQRLTALSYTDPLVGNTCYQTGCSVTGVCSSRGICAAVDGCECGGGFYGPDCSDWDCDGVSRKLTSTVCSGHGTCLAPDTCLCSGDYIGSDCEIWESTLR